MSVKTGVDFFSTLLETAGVAVIVIGALFSTAAAVWTLVSRQPRVSFYTIYRTLLSRAILLGLEFLVAADIIRTVAVEPTYQDLGMLAIIVLVRTFLSFTLEVEVNGHWPWQPGATGEKTGGTR